jgi:hypothetical protein
VRLRCIAIANAGQPGMWFGLNSAADDPCERSVSTHRPHRRGPMHTHTYTRAKVPHDEARGCGALRWHLQSRSVICNGLNSVR